MTPQDVAFGRLAQARRLVAPDALRAAAQALPPGTSLAAAVVERGLLAPATADALLRELAAHEVTRVDGPAGPPADPVAEAVTVAGGAPRPVGAGGLPEPGDVIADRFELRSVLGKGGMGAVFRARDRASGDEVALKVLLADAAPDERARARFQREAEAVARVDSHPGIVRIRAAGVHQGGQPWAAMDLIIGRDLKGLVKELGPRPLEVALELVEKVARAIQHCHERGIVHRDLKPANILVRDEDLSPMVTDFGLALDASAERLTRSGEVLGTPAYMPPEQVSGARAHMDARSDVYALGAILFELLAARPPFHGDGVHAVLKRVLLDPPPRPTSLRPELPADADAIVLKALAKDRMSRYPTAAAFADDCARLRRGEPIEARAPSRGELLRWRLRQRDPRVVAPLALLILAAAGALLLLLDRRPPGPTELLRARLAALAPALDASDPSRVDPQVAALASDLVACLPPLPERLRGDRPRPEAQRTLERLEALSALAPDDPDPRLAALAREVAGREEPLERLTLRVAVQAGSWPRDARRLPADSPEALLLRGLRDLGCGVAPGDPAALASAAGADALRRAAQDPGPAGLAAGRLLGELAEADAAAAGAAAAEVTAFAERFAEALRGARLQVAWSGAPPRAPDDPLRAYRAAAWRSAQRRALAALVERLRPLVEEVPERHLPRLHDALRIVIRDLVYRPGEAPGPPETAAAAAVLEQVTARVELLDPVQKQRAIAGVLVPLLGCVETATGEASELSARTFDLLFFSIQTWVQEGKLPPAEMALAFVRLGFLPTDHVPPELIRREVKARRFVGWAEEHRTGDAWLLAAEAVSGLELDEQFDGDLALRGTASEEELKRQALELAVTYRARAHGERLSPALRARLGLPPAVPLLAPMTPTWEGQSLGLLFTGLGTLEGAKASPSRDVLDACFEELEAVRERARFPDLTREVKFLSLGGNLMHGTHALRRLDEAWRADCLRRALAWYRAALEAGARLRARAKEGVRSAREGSLVGLSRDGDPERARVIGLSRPARDLSAALLEAGQPAEGRAVAEAAAAQLKAEGAAVPAAEVEYWLAACAIAAGQLDGLEALARGHLELGRSLKREGARSRARRQAIELVSSGRVILCQLALARGDRAAARAEYEALLEEVPGYEDAVDFWWRAPLEALRSPR